MIFKGLRWTVCRTVVPLATSMWSRNGCYVEFGKIVPHDSKDAVKTENIWRHSVPRKFAGATPHMPPDGTEFYDNGTSVDYWHVYAKPIKLRGHSLSNMAYAENGSMYLLYKGLVYMRGPKAKARNLLLRPGP